MVIHRRPQIIETRSRIGDWEGDLITGRTNRSAIATLVDRRSRYLKLVHLPAGHGAVAVRDALLAVMETLPAEARQSLTWDQGIEMSKHDELGPLLSDGVFFAYPSSPWQRGSNENTNGLLRQYFPKGTDLTLHSADHLQAVEARLNSRPRKTLGWLTPAEVFTASLASSDG